MGLAVLVVLLLAGKLTAPEFPQSVAWILLAFAIFNTYMLAWSARINAAVFAVFLTLEITEILLVIGNFSGNAAGTGITAIGGYMGIITALVAWYASAAVVVNSQGPRAVLPVGNPLWAEQAPAERPMRREVAGG
jgi:succinate-acetate transporter protein